MGTNGKMGRLILRAAVSFAVGVFVFATAYLSTWVYAGRSGTVEHFFARSALYELQQAVDLYRAETGAPPRTLGDALRLQYEKYDHWPWHVAEHPREDMPLKDQPESLEPRAFWTES